MYMHTSVVGQIEMVSIVPSAGIEPTSLAVQASVLIISPPGLPYVTIVPMSTHICSSLFERSVQTTIYVYVY